MVTLDAQRKRTLQYSNETPSITHFCEAVGSPIHLANGTRPDIAFAVNSISCAQSNPSALDWAAIVCIFHYLKTTLNFGLLFKSESDLLECHVDASLGTNDPDARSTSGYVITAFGDVSWCTKKQTHVALSSAEAEYVAASFACRQFVSLKHLLSFISKLEKIPIIYEDNKTAIALAKTLEAKSLKHVVPVSYTHLTLPTIYSV